MSIDRSFVHQLTDHGWCWMKQEKKKNIKWVARDTWVAVNIPWCLCVGNTSADTKNVLFTTASASLHFIHF